MYIRERSSGTASQILTTAIHDSERNNQTQLGKGGDESVWGEGGSDLQQQLWGRNVTATCFISSSIISKEAWTGSYTNLSVCLTRMHNGDTTRYVLHAYPKWAFSLSETSELLSKSNLVHNFGGKREVTRNAKRQKKKKKKEKQKNKINILQTELVREIFMPLIGAMKRY
jgi:hypothetical protein